MDAATLGKYLYDTRQLQEKTLEDAEKTLRIRRSTLEAFERGEFNVVGSDAQTRGLLRNYANYLRLDADRILELYESSKLEANKRARRRKKQTQPMPVVNGSVGLSAPRKITDTQPNLPVVRRAAPRDLGLPGLLANLSMAVLALGAMAIILAVTFSLLEDAPPPAPDPLALAERPSTLVPTPTPTLRPLLSPTPLTTPNPFRGQGIALLLDITSRAWVRVTVDGQERQAGLLRPGERLPFEGVSQIILDTSNGGGTQVTLNGVPQGLLGQRGQRVTIAYYPDRLEVLSAPQDEPTPIMSDTPAPTPTSPAATLALEMAATFAAVPPTFTPAGPSVTPAPSLTPSVTLPPTVTLTPSFTPSATPTITSTASNTPTPSITPRPTLTPSITPTPRPTAVLPPRTTPSNLPTPKGGGS
ncbi:MAG: DUF4115 domain-containing protein [Anaerolineae bacterium]|nr:DUF4115 domain-containing protein [Anaerolineae bacterium]MDW8171808.1 DUF4115 domain-containing protein [Anaerolineae bacterium]